MMPGCEHVHGKNIIGHGIDSIRFSYYDDRSFPPEALGWMMASWQGSFFALRLRQEKTWCWVYLGTQMVDWNPIDHCPISMVHEDMDGGRGEPCLWPCNPSSYPKPLNFEVGAPHRPDQKPHATHIFIEPQTFPHCRAINLERKWHSSAGTSQAFKSSFIKSSLFVAMAILRYIQAYLYYLNGFKQATLVTP